MRTHGQIDRATGNDPRSRRTRSRPRITPTKIKKPTTPKTLKDMEAKPKPRHNYDSKEEER
jgi:hypothetical protein